MSVYAITFTDQATPGFSIAPGSLDQHTNLRFYGMGSLAYGQGVDENFLQLLENFASPELTPGVPNPAYFDTTKMVKGQLWFNTTAGKMMVYNGTVWAPSGGTSSGSSAPSNPQVGDLWYDTVAGQLKVWNGSIWATMTATALTGNLDLGNNKIVNLASGTVSTDGINKGQLDTAILGVSGTLANAILKDGTVAMTASLDLNSNKIINLATGTVSTDAVNLGQMNTAIGVVSSSLSSLSSNTVTISGNQTLIGQKVPASGTIPASGSITFDANAYGQVATVTLTSSATMNAPTNILQHALYLLSIVQGGSGSYTLSWNAAFKFGSLGAPTLTTTVGKTDIISFVGGAGNTLVCIGTRMNAI